ncbi:Uncharacterized protein YR821_p10012 (plasmid) [Yersinia ruckeri]|nr:Uncharacterized protein YR821_p10012 [Yersinia ruckeri]
MQDHRLKRPESAHIDFFKKKCAYVFRTVKSLYRAFEADLKGGLKILACDFERLCLSDLVL